MHINVLTLLKQSTAAAHLSSASWAETLKEDEGLVFELSPPDTKSNDSSRKVNMSTLLFAHKTFFTNDLVSEALKACGLIGFVSFRSFWSETTNDKKAGVLC